MTITFTQGHRITEKMELCRCSVVKQHEETQMFAMVDYIRGIMSKKCGEYELFELLLFLL